jgi:hypothetical protein
MKCWQVTLWVNRVDFSLSAPCPLSAPSRQKSGRPGCQLRANRVIRATDAPQQNNPLFDHFVSP